jgi:hypothetical protein
MHPVTFQALLENTDDLNFLAARVLWLARPSNKPSEGGVSVASIIRLACIPVVKLFGLAGFWRRDCVIDVIRNVQLVLIVEADVRRVVAWNEQWEGEIGLGLQIQAHRLGECGWVWASWVRNESL